MTRSEPLPVPSDTARAAVRAPGGRPAHAPVDVTRMHAVTPETTALVDMVLDYAHRRILGEQSPLDKPMTPSELRRLASGSISETGIGGRRALALFENVLAPACITTDHPRYLSFIPSAPTKAATAFDLIVSATAVYGGSWMEGSGAVFAENEVLDWLGREFGLPEGSGGVFVQGGTIGNLSALVAARDHRARALAAAGRPRPARWIIVGSAEAHSSIAAAARVMDVDVVAVPVGDSGMLRGEQVRPVLEQHGEAVIAVVATGGSTNFGIVDDIASIAALKSAHDFWLHVDGAYGLAAALDPASRHRFAGVEAADSLIVDPHKWLFTPFDACALLYRDPEIGRLAHTQHAEYLDALTGASDWNPSDFSVQLTRRARGLPLWFSLATFGAEAYRAAIGASIDLAHAIAADIAERPYLRLVRDPQLSVVVFEREGWEPADYAAWSAGLLEEQRAFVVPSSHAGRTNARFAIVNPLTTLDDLTGILDSMA